MKKSLVVLTGAGISAESGIKTFRDSDGLWEGHDIMEVASPVGWKNDPKLVLNFYNKRRQQLLTVKPNRAHEILVELEQLFDVTIITQNVDDLHERAGSTNILHLHGELLKSRSSLDEHLVYECKTDIHIGDLCEKKSQIRPHIVWFGEAVPAIEKAIKITKKADVILIIGTSLQVYPAASLIDYAKTSAAVYYVDNNPSPILNPKNDITIITDVATAGLEIFQNELIHSIHK
ncbi:SIR2 family NAD-dependent protein deacylase [Flavobacterium sp. '19STA2R22 D10 B1']|uniref:SIR2 family NAD-dependent protein deacylase n=1 Tax=Flavobacterium aerium TaxID=3037261 RepID=UPI00278C6E3E|nr:NAD-dependent deacylase [Flavobacterium sp. '19STA2R22 D10 B1']